MQKKMKNTRKINTGLFARVMAMGLFLSSCSLDIEETDALISDEGGVFSGVESVDGSIETLYNNISGQMATQENLYALSEVTTDILVVPTRGTDWGDNGVWRTLHAHTWGPTHNFITNVWNDRNGAVLRATEVIDPLSNANTEQLAHAKFVRAYNMWIVMDCFGQVPFRNATDGPDVIPTVMTRAEAYDMIVQDLNDAIADLPASDPTAGTKFRAVKATARFMLAKVKLNAVVYKGSYGATDLQDVIDLVDAIEADGYAITPDYFQTFVGPTFPNTDVIWAVPADAGSKIWSALHYNQAHPGNTGGGWNGFSTLSEFYDKFEGPPDDNRIGGTQEERRGYVHIESTTTPDNVGFGYGFQFGHQMYGWRYLNAAGVETAAPPPADPEPGEEYVDPVGYVVELKTRTGEPLIFTKEFPGLIGNNEVTGMRLLKYSPANGSFTSGQVVARFADAHLMRAEAMFRLGDAPGALAEINELRAARENTSDLGALTEMDILDERGRELYMENWRRNDMIRFGVFKNAWEFKEAGDGHTDLFPIPASALLSNPNLVQNPGY